jgi:hypothetical protein
MKNLSILLLLIGSFAASCKDYKSKLVERKACVITEVETFSPGQRHTMQVDYEWHATTSCGMKHTFKSAVEVGDTIWVEYRKIEK